ncbi:MAG: transcriptional regulator [Deltaproteobacteria bacterium]|jgi:polyhydroxyalkanoate synthesis repressor PhaR|nr:MAG: transcriptional regulator [Deltaproteobacteria bacterium]
MEETLVLKKYSNRRLYDTEKSIYVTLQAVADLVRDGRQVKVVDAKSKEDVTAFILTQIIVEEAKNKNTLLPAPLLHLIIQFGNNMLAEFFENYLQQIIKAYLAQKATFEEQFKQWIGSGMNLSELAGRSMGGLGGLNTLFELNPFLKSRYPHASDDEGSDGEKK